MRSAHKALYSLRKERLERSTGEETGHCYTEYRQIRLSADVVFQVDSNTCICSADAVQVTATSVGVSTPTETHRHCGSGNMAAAANSKSCWTTKKWHRFATQCYKSYCGSFVYTLNEVLPCLWMNLHSPLAIYVTSTNLRRVLMLFWPCILVNLLKPTVYVMHHQFNIQQLYALPTLYLCVLYLSENKQRLVPLTA